MGQHCFFFYSDLSSNNYCRRHSSKIPCPKNRRSNITLCLFGTWAMYNHLWMIDLKRNHQFPWLCEITRGYFDQVCGFVSPTQASCFLCYIGGLSSLHFQRCHILLLWQKILQVDQDCRGKNALSWHLMSLLLVLKTCTSCAWPLTHRLWIGFNCFARHVRYSQQSQASHRNK